MGKVLVMEDDIDISNLLKMHLEQAGHEIVAAYDGKTAVDMFGSDFDLVILDVMVPIINGFEVLKIIREKSEVPVIFITARTEDSDKVLGLGLGADDYVEKPFSVIEVTSRVEAHLRRYLKYSSKKISEVVKNGAVMVDKSKHIITCDSLELNLNNKEYKMLMMFMENLGMIFTKKQIYEHVWEDEYYVDVDNNTIMVHISHLRDKIGTDRENRKYITTIKGIGYRMEKFDE